MLRKGLVRAAACAALTCAGLVRADSTKAETPLVSSDLSLSASQPKFMDAAPAPAPDMPLMALLDKVGIGKGLKEAGINVGGTVEGSLTYGFSHPPGGVFTGRVFDFEDQDPTLNGVMLFAEKTVSDALGKGQFDVGARVEWRWGADSRLIHSVGLFDYYGASPDNQWDLTQAYVDVAVPIGNGLLVRAGKFNTPIGQEVIDPTGNIFYSHSFLFGYAIPFTHTGVTGTYSLNKEWTVMAGITRGWDTSLEDNNDTIDILGSLSYQATADTKFVLNVVSGADQPGDNGNWRTLFDFIMSTKLGDNLLVAINADYAFERNSAASATGEDAQWYGVAAYAQLQFSPMISLNMRGEYFNDDDGVRLTGAVGGAGVFEATVGLGITPFPDDAYGKNLVIRPEVRYDYATKGFFDAGTDHSQWTAAIDAYYKF